MPQEKHHYILYNPVGCFNPSEKCRLTYIFWIISLSNGKKNTMLEMNGTQRLEIGNPKMKGKKANHVHFMR